MARVTYGALVTDIRGSLGGTTFQRNKYGSSAKNKSFPGNPLSVYREQIKQSIRLVTQHWSALTDTQRNLWITFATTNPQPCHNNSSANLSGYAVYLRMNLYYNLVTTGFIDEPGFTLPILPTVSVSMAWSGPDLNFTITTGSTHLETALQVHFSRPISPGINYCGNKTRFFEEESCSTATYVINDKYQAILGTLPSVGDYLFVKIQPKGVTCPWFFAPIIFKIQVS